MIPADSSDRLILFAVGLLVLLGPVLILVVTLGVLVLFGDLALGRITPVEFLELYIIDLLVFVALAYGIYRLTAWLVIHRLPASLDSIAADDAGADEESEPEDT